jgi:hypothetical protein
MNYTKGLIHWQKELSPFSYVRVMIYPDMQTAKIEMQTWDILHENDLEETCTEAEFYEALAKAQSIIMQASGIELHTLNVEGGAYVD